VARGLEFAAVTLVLGLAAVAPGLEFAAVTLVLGLAAVALGLEFAAVTLVYRGRSDEQRGCRTGRTSGEYADMISVVARAT
jgi:hypothetical protein